MAMIGDPIYFFTLSNLPKQSRAPPFPFLLAMAMNRGT